MVNTTTLLVLLVAFLATASALDCYQCTGGAECSDLENAKVIECRGGAEFCSKIVLSGEVTRACYKADDDENRQVGCKTRGDTTSCYCDSDKCNGASTTAVTGLATWKVLAALTAVLLPTALGARVVL